MQDVPRPFDTIDGSNPNVGARGRALPKRDLSRRLVPAKALNLLSSTGLSYVCDEVPATLPADLCRVFQRALEGNRHSVVVVIAANLAASLIINATVGSQCVNVSAREVSYEVAHIGKVRAFRQEEASGLGVEVVVNRLGGSVELKKLTAGEQAWILYASLSDISDSLLSSKGMALEVTQEARALLLATESTEAEGISPVRRAIQNLVLDTLERAVSGLESTKGLVFAATATGYFISQEDPTLK